MLLHDVRNEDGIRAPHIRRTRAAHAHTRCTVQARHTRADTPHAHVHAAGNFFNDVHELYVKVLMNPFHAFNAPIASQLFDARVKVLGRKYF